MDEWINSGLKIEKNMLNTRHIVPLFAFGSAGGRLLTLGNTDESKRLKT